MKLIIVEHGQTEHGAQRLHQFANSELSKVGVKQAELLARRIKDSDADIIVSSKLTRAKQTAQIIAKQIKKKILYTALLNEKRRPSEIEGKSIDSKDVVSIKKEIKMHAVDKNWHYSDEENISEFRERIIKLLGYISQRREKTVMIVSHSYVITSLVALMLLGEKDLTTERMQTISKFLDLDNTGVSECVQDKEGKWKLRRWNDHSHLN